MLKNIQILSIFIQKTAKIVKYYAILLHKSEPLNYFFNNELNFIKPIDSGGGVVRIGAQNELQTTQLKKQEETFMKRKIRLMTTIVAMCMVVLIMSMGIYAATQVTIGGTGSITFAQLSDVSADVTYAYGATGDTVEYTLADDQTHLGTQVSLKDDSANIPFDSAEDDYTYSFTITNTFDGNYSINAAFSQSLDDNDFITMTTTYAVTTNKSATAGSDTALTEGSKTIVIPQGETLTITVVFDIVDANYQELKETGVDLTYDIQLVLSKATA